MSDLSRPVKAMVLAQLDASPGVTNQVSPTNIFPMQSPATPSYPFIRYEPLDIDAYETTCGEGVAIGIRLHVFAEGEDSAQLISSAVVTSLEAIQGFQSFDWVRTQFLPDTEPSIWHGMIDFAAVHTA